MGFKALDFNPFPTQISPITPPGKAELHKVFTVARTDTASTLKALVPAQSSIVAVTLYGSVASNAATTATATITISNNSGVISTGTYNVLTNGATTGIVQMSNLPNEEPTPLNGDLKINVQYAETGTASTLGGPWKVRVAYVQ